MLHEPSQLDQAEMRQEFRRLHREVGHDGCMQVLFEMMKAAEWLSEIMLEESQNGHR